MRKTRQEKMSSDEIVEELAKYGYTKKDAAIIIRDFTDMVMKSVAAGKRVSIFGFGEFYPCHVCSKRIRDVNTMEEKNTSDAIVPKFRAGKTFKRNIVIG